MNLATAIHRVSGNCEKHFKVGGQRSRLQPDQLTYSGRGLYFDSLTSRLVCLCQAFDVDSCNRNTDVALLFQFAEFVVKMSSYITAPHKSLCYYYYYYYCCCYYYTKIDNGGILLRTERRVLHFSVYNLQLSTL